MPVTISALAPIFPIEDVGTSTRGLEQYSVDGGGECANSSAAMPVSGDYCNRELIIILVLIIRKV